MVFNSDINNSRVVEMRNTNNKQKQEKNTRKNKNQKNYLGKNLKHIVPQVGHFPFIAFRVEPPLPLTSTIWGSLAITSTLHFMHLALYSVIF